MPTTGMVPSTVAPSGFSSDSTAYSANEMTSMATSSISPIFRLTSSLIVTHLLNLTSTMGVNAMLTPPVPTSTAFPPLTSPPPGQSQAGIRMVGRTSRQSSSDSDQLDVMNKHFAKVIDPVAIATGIVGNALLAVVFLITPLRLRPLSHTLAGLGVVDLLYTLSCMLVYLTNKGVQVYRVPGACQITTFTLVFSKSVEAWYIFISHLNRLNAHTNSSRESRKRRVFNTKFAVFLVALLVAAPLLHVLWSMETVRVGGATFCVPMKETMQIHLTLRKIEIIANVFLPLTLIVGIDLMLIMKLALHYVFKEDDEEDDSMRHVEDYPSSYCSEKGFGNNRDQSPRTPSKDIVYMNNKERLKNRLSTIDEFSSAISKETSHQLKEVTVSCHKQSEHISMQDFKLPNSEKCDNGAKVLEDRKSSLCSIASLSAPSNDSSDVSACQISHHSTEKMSESSNRHSTVDASDIETHDFETVKLTRDKELSIASLFSEKSSNFSSVPMTPEKPLTSCNDDVISPPAKSKLYSSMSLVWSSFKISKCKRSDSMQVSFRQESYASEQRSSRSNSSINNVSQNNSISASQWRSYTFASYTSQSSRSQVVQEDHAFPNDITACTVGTMLTGFAYAALVLPSSYTYAIRLFIESPYTRPSREVLQQAVLFESLVKINAVYKFLMYSLVMSSFRHAIIWLLTHWIPSKITRMSSICLWGPAANKKDKTYV